MDSYPPFYIAFTGIANTTSTPIGVEGGEGGGSRGEEQSYTSTLKSTKWCPLVLYSATHSHHTKQLNP